MDSSTELPRRRPRSLALELVEALGDRIREGRLAAGDKLPTEAEFMAEFGVSRTVVREAISKLQAAGLVQTRHGIGTFVVGLGEAAPFKLAPEQFATLRDVIAVLELRIGIETEAASLAAQRRNADNLRQMRSALDAVAAAVEQGRDAVGPDFQFHLEIARATQNAHFADLMASLGAMIIPRARLGGAAGMSPPGRHRPEADGLRQTTDGPQGASVSGLSPKGELQRAQPEASTINDEQRLYLRRVNAEHESIYDAIRNQDGEAARAAMRTHLANSRERRRRATAMGFDST